MRRNIKINKNRDVILKLMKQRCFIINLNTKQINRFQRITIEDKHIVYKHLGSI